MSWPISKVSPSTLAGSRNIKKAVIGGDSFTSETSNAFTGVSQTGLSNISGGVSLRGASLNTTTTGTLSLVVSGSLKTLSWTLTGDTAGAPVTAVDGLLTLVSGDGLHTVKIGVTTRQLPAASQSDVLSPSTRYWRWAQGSMAGMAEVLTNRAVQFLPDLGIDGNTSGDLVKRIPQFLAQGADIIWINILTNDGPAGALPPATSMANMAAILQSLSLAGASVVLNGITPRYGAIPANGVTATDTGYTAAINSQAIRLNALTASLTKAYPNVAYNDLWNKAVDHETGRVLNYTTLEGLHPMGSLGLWSALGFYDFIKAHTALNSFQQNSGEGSYYDAVNNPGGNLLTANQGQFVGASGTLGVGASLTPRWVLGASSVKDLSWCISGGNLWRCLVGGVNGMVAPVGPVGTVVSDGVVLWSCVSSGALYPWTSGLNVVVGDTLVVSGGKLVYYTVAGITGGSAPNPVGSAVADGTATCINYGTGYDTGFGTGWTISRGSGGKGSALTVQCHKTVVNGKIVQEFIFSGAVGDERQGNAEEIILFPSSLPAGSISAVSGGILYDQSMPLEILDGDGCYGLYMDCIMVVGGNTALNLTPDALQLKSHYYGLGALVGQKTLGLIPVPWQPGTTSAQPRFFIQSKSQGVFRLRLTDFDCHQIV